MKQLYLVKPVIPSRNIFPVFGSDVRWLYWFQKKSLPDQPTNKKKGVS